MSMSAPAGSSVRDRPAGLPRLLAGLDGRDEAMSLVSHERVHGPLPRLSGHELIESVEHSGLRGRGGADFPTARKLRSVAERRRRASAVVVNGSETEPASAKDRLLLSRLPHLVLDGAVLAARAIRAREVIVKAPMIALASVQEAIDERSDDRVPISVASGPGGYVTGEETAVIQYLNGGAPTPMFTPPLPFERGYRGGPTLVQNPETLAQVALIARYGEHWFRELGTDADPGSALVTISGAVVAPGVYELAFGTPISGLLQAAGGSTEPLQALLVGGYFGTWVESSRALRLRLAREDLRSVGCSLGSGVLIALGESACGLHESARVIEYLAAESAGQCGPCVFGLRAIADGFCALADGVANEDDLERLQRWTSEVRGRGACHHPDGAARFVQSALSAFGWEIEPHRRLRCVAPPAGLPVGPTTPIAHPGAGTRPGAGAGRR